MEYQLAADGRLWRGVFAVPDKIVDEYLKLAGASQLKVLLYFLRHHGESVSLETLSSVLGYAGGDVVDALQYWVERGILSPAGEAATMEPPAEIQKKAPVPKPAEPPREEEPKRKLITVVPSAPTQEDIARRGNECPEYAFLLNETQMKLGRTISVSEQGMLLTMMDHYGLPAEVILMILEYAVSVKKTGTAYLLKLAKNWAEEEIFTLEKAEQKLRRIQQANSIWSRVKETTGINHPMPTAKQQEYLEQWTGKYQFSADMICLALEEMMNHTSKISFPYTNKILENWHHNRVNTPDEVLKLNRKHIEKEASGGKKTSYDLEQFESDSLYQPLIYRKGE